MRREQFFNQVNPHSIAQKGYQMGIELNVPKMKISFYHVKFHNIFLLNNFIIILVTMGYV
jgi:hypothetical protein